MSKNSWSSHPHSGIRSDRPGSASAVPAFYYSLERTELLALVPRGTHRLLDVGCGAGAFGVAIKASLHAVVWGIEINPQAASIANIKLDRVIVGDAVYALRQLEGERFDTVCFNDILEHLVDPAAALSAAARLLKSEGCVVLSVPNLRFYRVLKQILVEHDFRYEAWGVMDSTHLRFFTEKSMRRLLSETGFAVDVLSGINHRQPPGTIGHLASLLSRTLCRPWIGDIWFQQFACRARLCSS